MEFFEVRAAGAASSARPTVRADSAGVVITVPAAIADHSGLTGSKVRLMFGVDAGAGVGARAVRLVADDAGAWEVARRKDVLRVRSAELRPNADVPETVLEFDCGYGELTLRLPTPWDLAAEHLVVRPAGKPRSSEKSRGERGGGA